MTPRLIRSFLVGLVALTATLVAVPGTAGASPAAPRFGLGRGTSTVAVPITCTFGPNTPIVHETVEVSVTSPKILFPFSHYVASFKAHIDNIVAPFDVKDFSITSTYNVSGPVHPQGAIGFVESPQNIAAGSQPTTPTFQHGFTPGFSAGTVSYRFDAIGYTFAYVATGPIQATCTLDNGPVVIRQATVV